MQGRWFTTRSARGSLCDNGAGPSLERFCHRKLEGQIGLTERETCPIMVLEGSNIDQFEAS